MKKMKKLLLTLLSVVLAFTMVFAVACDNNNQDPTPTPTPPSGDGGGGGGSGDGDGGGGSGDGGGGSSTPIDAEKITLPESTLKFSAITPTTNAEAKSRWLITYGATGIDITVYVEDTTIYEDSSSVYSSDRIEVRVAKEQDVTGYSDKTVGIAVSSEGKLVVKDLKTNSDIASHGITATAKKFTVSGDAVEGYYINLLIPYEITEVTQADKDMAVCVGLTNASSMVETKTVYYDEYGTKADSVKTYFLVVDDNTYSLNSNLLESIDVLFAGDSYVDIWDNTVSKSSYLKMVSDNNLNAVNIGIGGTRIEQWAGDKLKDLRFTYNPGKVVFHIGVNDIDDANQTAQQTIDELKEFYNAYHTAFARAELYWIGLIPNTTFRQHNEKYLEVNTAMEAFATENEWFNYIDMWDSFCEDGKTGEGGTEIAPRLNMFPMTDGLHLSLEFGYPLWTKIITESLGYDRPNGTAFGDTEDGKLAYSSGWKFDVNGNQAENTDGMGEQAVWYNKGESANVLFEVDIKSPTLLLSSDAYTKVGVALRNNNVTVLAYLDLSAGGAQSGGIQMVYRDNNTNMVNDWSWGAQSASAMIGQNATQQYVRIGVAKLGNKLYMLVDGEKKIEWSISALGADSEVAVGIIGFEREMLVKNASYSDDETAIEYALRATRTITVPEYDGTTIEVNKTKAKFGDEITVSIKSTEKIKKVSYTDGSTTTDITSTLFGGVYKFTMPDANVSLLVEFEGLLSVDLSQADGKITASTLTPKAGVEVTFTAIENIHISKLFANGVEIEPQSGEYKLVVTEDVVITGVFYEKLHGIVLDGVADEELYGEVSTVAYYNQDRTITLHGVKTAQGVFINAVAVTNTKKTDAPDWFNNTNLEFYLNDGAQRYANINNAMSGVTTMFWKTVDPQEAGGKYTHSVELFIAKELIPEWNDDRDIFLNYAWKTQGEGGLPQGNAIHGHMVPDGGDWWCKHHIGGAWFHNGAPYPRVRNLFLTNDGLYIPMATKATIDGDLSEFERFTPTTLGDASRAQFTINGFVGDDGLYLAFEINHGAWSEGGKTDWSHNDNLEFRINGLNVTILFINGELSLSGVFTEGKAITTANGDRQLTKLEVFMPGEFDVYRLQLGVNGAGFGGWQALIWDANNVYITKDGISNTDPATSEITLDGEFTDELWTEDVKEKSFSGKANGATVSMFGVKTGLGVYLGFTIVHTKPANEHCQNDGTLWWHYLGPEIRLAKAAGFQIAASTFNGGTGINCQVGVKTVDNGDDTYTTCFEIFVPYYPCVMPVGSVDVAVGGIFETGFTGVFGGWETPAHTITENGIIKI